jgi:hypothetical protein
VPRGELRRADSLDRCGGEVVERCRLPRTQATADRRFAGGNDPALEARAGAGGEEGPVEGHLAARLEPAEPPDEPGPALRADQVADRAWAACELFEEVRVGGLQAGTGSIVAGPALRDELEPLEQLRREHRPDDEGGRREVVVGDPARERQGEGREQRAIRAHPVGDGPRFDAGCRRAIAENDAEGLAATVRDEDGLARLERLEAFRDGVGPRPAAASADGVDRDLDGSERCHESVRRDGLGVCRQLERRLIDHNGDCRRRRSPHGPLSAPGRRNRTRHRAVRWRPCRRRSG